MNAHKYSTEIALPLYQRLQKEPAADDLRWAAVVALNQVSDYLARDEVPNEDDRNKLSKKARKIRESCDELKMLGIVADAFKHALKIIKNGVIAESTTVREDIFALKDLFSERDFFSTRVIDVSKQPVSIGPLLEGAVESLREKCGL